MAVYGYGTIFLSKYISFLCGYKRNITFSLIKMYNPLHMFLHQLVPHFFLPSRLGLKNKPTASRQSGKIPPTNVLI